MNLPLNIVIGNAISLIAGIFILFSMWVNDEKEVYKHQFSNAFILTISSAFFFSWTGVVTMAIAASRNAMVYKDRLTFNWTIFFIIVSLTVGCLVNTMGIVGLLPIIALVQITLSNYYLKSIKAIKISFIVNSIIYIIYFFEIWDFSSVAIESVTVAVGMISLLRLINLNKPIFCNNEVS